MEQSVQKANKAKCKRALRVRKQVRGSSERPRLSVVKTNKHVIAQIIDDERGVTLAAASTQEKQLRGTSEGKRSKAAAKAAGERLGLKAKELGIQALVFDRGPHKYHGVLAELADAIRSCGLNV